MKKFIALCLSLILMVSSTQIFGGFSCLADGGLTITSITPFVVGGDQAVLEVAFNNPANTGGNLINMQDTDTYVQNDILINGESVNDIINSGAIDTQVWINYVNGKMDIWILNTCTAKLKLDGTDTIVFKSGFTTPTGGTFASDNTLTYNGTTWFENVTVNDLSISNIASFSLSDDQSVLEVTFNNPTNAGRDLLNLQDTDTYIQNDILINGESVKDICNSGAIDTQLWINYANGGKMDIYIRNTCTKKLKLDGTDTIVFKSGFAIPTGHAFASDATLTYNGTTWFKNETINDLSIATVTPFAVDGYEAVLEFAFNNPANNGDNLINIQDTDTYVQNDILINGKSVKDICNTGALDTQVRINYVGGKMDIWIPNTCTEKLKLDGTDTVVFKSGFDTPTGHAFASDITSTYNGTTWIVNDLSINNITTFEMAGNQSVLELAFNNPANVGNNLVNTQDADTYVQNDMLINGESIKDICNSGALDMQVWVNYVNGKMDIFIQDTCTEKLKLDGTDIITFKSGFTTPTGRTFASDVSLSYIAYSSKWVPSNFVSFGNYKVSADNTITNIPLGTTLSSFKNSLNQANGVDVEFSNANSDGTVGTGTNVNITVNGDTLSYTIGIYGDVNGDGKIDLSDLVAIRDSLLGKSLLQGAFAKAGDFYSENSITLNDLVGIMASISGTGNINQNS